MPRRVRDLPLRHRLALIGVAGVLGVMLATVVAFNVFEDWQSRREATASIEDGLGWEPSSNTPATRTVSYLFLSDGQVDIDDLDWYTDLDLEVGQWCLEHLEVGTLRRAVLADASVFVEIEPADWEGGRDDYLVCYVDVTAQRDLIATVNVAMTLIALIGCVAVGLAGYHAGIRIEEAQDSQKRFFENMSHELKTPLAAIVGYAEGIGEGVVEPGRGARLIRREAARMGTIVSEIMDLSRLEAGAYPVHLEECELSSLVQDCLMPFEHVVRRKHLTVELDLAQGTVRCDPDLFLHALENVCSNAFRHAATLVRITFDGRLLVVANDGDLPDERDVARLFDRFATSTASSGGTGIGLALTAEICELHGWRIEARVAGGLLEVTFVLG